jgi:hypothetical protein
MVPRTPPSFNVPQPLTLEATPPFLELPWLAQEAEVRAAVRRCIGLMRRAAEGRLDGRQATADGEHHALPEALEPLLTSGRDVHGIAEDRHISDVIVFNAPKIADALHDAELEKARRALTLLLRRRMPEIVASAEQLRLSDSGLLLYPPGSHMGWHTNAKRPGLRLMLTWIEPEGDEPVNSYFRYRDPQTGEIVTARDSGLNARLLNIRTVPPVWHAIYTNAWRFTLATFIAPDYARGSLLRRVLRRVRRTLRGGV